MEYNKLNTLVLIGLISKSFKIKKFKKYEISVYFSATEANK